MNQSTTTPATVTDPICRMNIDPSKAAGSSAYDGVTYYFCSRGCETAFDAAPALHASTTAETPKAASCCATTQSCC